VLRRSKIPTAGCLTRGKDTPLLTPSLTDGDLSDFGSATSSLARTLKVVKILSEWQEEHEDIVLTEDSYIGRWQDFALTMHNVFPTSHSRLRGRHKQISDRECSPSTSSQYQEVFNETIVAKWQSRLQIPTHKACAYLSSQNWSDSDPLPQIRLHPEPGPRSDRADLVRHPNVHLHLQ
jgi:hypothetical protein